MMKYPVRYYQLELEETERFYSRIERTDGCHYWLNIDGSRATNYGRLHVRRDGRVVSLSAHRAQFILQGGDPTVEVVRHQCDNPPCVNPDHLLGGTHGDNWRDAIARDRAKAHGVPFSVWYAYRDHGISHGEWVCSHCDRMRPADQFSPRNTAEGNMRPVQAWCKECMNIVRAARPDRQKSGFAA